MPRNTDVNKTYARKAREYGRLHKLSFDAAYHLMLSANTADGVVSTGLDPEAPAEAALSAADQAALSAARTAIGI